MGVGARVCVCVAAGGGGERLRSPQHSSELTRLKGKDGAGTSKKVKKLKSSSIGVWHQTAPTSSLESLGGKFKQEMKKVRVLSRPSKRFALVYYPQRLHDSG